MDTSSESTTSTSSSNQTFRNEISNEKTHSTDSDSNERSIENNDVHLEDINEIAYNEELYQVRENSAEPTSTSESEQVNL